MFPSSSSNQAAVFEPTQSTAAAIGQRRKPEPQGRPGYVRADTVHQGDSAGTKGVYHINAVDAVTQWQVVGCAEKISETYLVPVLAAVLAQFPFPIRGFHADNGSEYINHRINDQWRICFRWASDGVYDVEIVDSH